VGARWVLSYCQYAARAGGQIWLSATRQSAKLSDAGHRARRCGATGAGALGSRAPRSGREVLAPGQVDICPTCVVWWRYRRISQGVLSERRSYRAEDRAEQEAGASFDRFSSI
jgi:hypothetical protein